MANDGEYLRIGKYVKRVRASDGDIDVWVRGNRYEIRGEDPEELAVTLLNTFTFVYNNGDSMINPNSIDKIDIIRKSSGAKKVSKGNPGGNEVKSSGGSSGNSSKE